MRGLPDDVDDAPCVRLDQHRPVVHVHVAILVIGDRVQLDVARQNFADADFGFDLNRIVAVGLDVADDRRARLDVLDAADRTFVDVDVRAKVIEIVGVDPAGDLAGFDLAPAAHAVAAEDGCFGFRRNDADDLML